MKGRGFAALAFAVGLAAPAVVCTATARTPAPAPAPPASPPVAEKSAPRSIPIPDVARQAEEVGRLIRDFDALVQPAVAVYGALREAGIRAGGPK
jgi:hypothetical protein